MVNVFETDICIDYGMELPADFSQVVYEYFAKKVRASIDKEVEDSQLYMYAQDNQGIQDKLQLCHLVCLKDKSYIFLGKHKPFHYTFEVDPDEELYTIEKAPESLPFLQTYTEGQDDEMSENLSFIGCWLAGMVGYPDYQKVEFEPTLYIGAYSHC